MQVFYVYFIKKALRAGIYPRELFLQLVQRETTRKGCHQRVAMVELPIGRLTVVMCEWFKIQSAKDIQVDF